MKLTGAAILVSRGMKVLQAAPAAYPYRSAAREADMFGWFRRGRNRAGSVDRVRAGRGLVPPIPEEFLARGRREPERRAVVVVTPAAATQVRAAAEGAGLGRWYVRVRVDVTRFDGVVPAEFQNRVDIDTVVDPEADYLDESQGVPVAVDRRTARFMEGVVLDWGTKPDGTTGFNLLPAAR